MIFWLFLVCPKTKKPRNLLDFEVLTLIDFYSAEEEGFEPPDPCGSPVFKTGAINRSTTPLFNNTLDLFSRPVLAIAIGKPLFHSSVSPKARFGSANVYVSGFPPKP